MQNKRGKWVGSEEKGRRTRRAYMQFSGERSKDARNNLPDPEAISMSVFIDERVFISMSVCISIKSMHLH